MALFGRYCDGEVIFVATRSPRPSGEEVSFTITLASGEPLIMATGRVEGSYSDGDGPHGRAGMLIRFHDVAIASQAIVDELARRRNEAGAFPRGPASTGKHDTIAEDRAIDDGSESEHETRPSGVPRVLAGSGSGPTPAPIAVPKPSPLIVKPAATPPPVRLRPRADRNGGLAELNEMVSIGPSRVPYPAGKDADSDFGDEASWDEAGGPGFADPAGRGSRVPARADSLSWPEVTWLEALVDCTVYEEDGVGDEPGPPAAAEKVARPRRDAWEDDETIPPWLRGPQPDDVMDVTTGSPEGDTPVARVAGRVEFHDPTPIPKSADPKTAESTESTAPAGPAPAVEIVPLSTGRPKGREARASVAVDLSAPARMEQADSARLPARLPLVLAASLASAAVGLVLGYAAGTSGWLTWQTGEQQAARASVVVASESPQAAELRGGGPSAATTASSVVPPDPQPAREESGDAEAGAGNTADGDWGKDARRREDKADEADDEGVRAGRGGRGKRSGGRDHALAPDRCGFEVQSEPGSSEIVIAGEVRGVTPVRIELACGAQDIEVRHLRYQSAFRRLRLRPGKLDHLEVKLDRPDYKLRIASTPPGASVTVNGRPAGITPMVATVKGYKHIRVRIERPGYDAWSEKVYPREPLSKLTVKLTPHGFTPVTRPSIEVIPPWLPQPRAATDAGPD